MEIRRWLYYVVVNCALVFYIAAKPFSLNKLIESESNQNEVIHTTISPKIEELEPAPEQLSLNKGLKPLKRIAKKFKETGTKIYLTPLGKKISPFKYRKTYQIKSPLKPKRVKNSLRTRQKRKNQSIKREIDRNAILNKKYVPLLRSLGMLFDNILGSDSGESFEKTKHKKRLRYYLDDDDDDDSEVPCKCLRQREPNPDPASKEETVTVSEVLAPEVTDTTEIAAKESDNPSTGNLNTFRQHQNIPLLLTRNTSGTRRNHHGLSERSRAAHNGSAERDISGHNGDSKHNSKHGQEQSDAESDEDYSDSYSRNDASSIRIQGRVRGREYRNSAEKADESGAISEDKTENFMASRENTAEYNGPYKLETERDETKSRKLLSEPVGRQREFLSNSKIIDFAESIQSEKNHKEGVVTATHDSSGSQRLIDGDGPYSSKNKKVHSRPETVIYKLPEVTNRYLKSAESTHENDVINDFALSEQNGDYNDTELPIFGTYEYELNSTEKEETNTRSNTVLNKELVAEQPRDISTKSKDKTSVLQNPAETIHTKFKNEGNDSIEARKSEDQLRHKKHFTRNSTIVKSDTVSNSSEVKISQYLTKTKTLKSRGPVVMIIDGYSVTRHKNGENKLAEKAIRIRP